MATEIPIAKTEIFPWMEDVHREVGVDRIQACYDRGVRSPEWKGNSLYFFLPHGPEGVTCFKFRLNQDDYRRGWLWVIKEVLGE